MKTLKQTDFLALKISALQSKQTAELLEVKNQILVVQNYVLNFNFLEKGIETFYKTATNKSNIFSTLSSIVVGYISNKMVVGDSKNMFTKILGYGVQFAVTKLLSKTINK
jgi:hypothetical protein